MATAFTHGLVGAALYPLAPRELRRPKLGVVLAVVAMIPDLDVIAFRLGIPYEHPFGHRGFSHSLVFAALLGVVVPSVSFPNVRRFSRAWLALVSLVALSVASHGILDALTDAGLGVGFFVPFSDERYFFPWRPLLTSPLQPLAFFDAHGLAILLNEASYVWLPVAIGLLCLIAGRALLARHG
jgi:inner membrane protein